MSSAVASGGLADKTAAVAAQGDVREVLQYVPRFRGKVFVVLIDAGLLPEPAVAEALLDLAALEDLGVKLVLGVLGGDLQDLHDWTVECEMKVARVDHRVGEPAAVAETREILGRGQTAVVDASGSGPLAAEVVEFALAIGAAKVIALLEEAILIDGNPVPAVRAAEAEALAASGDGDAGRTCCGPRRRRAGAGCRGCTCSTAGGRGVGGRVVLERGRGHDGARRQLPGDPAAGRGGHSGIVRHDRPFGAADAAGGADV